MSIAPFASPLHKIGWLSTTAVNTGGEIGFTVIIDDSAVQPFASVIWN